MTTKRGRKTGRSVSSQPSRMRARRRSLSLCGLTCLGLLASCSAVTIDEAVYYHLPDVRVQAVDRPLPIVLRVANFSVAPHLDGSRVLTHDASERMRARGRERWSAPLAALVSNSVREGVLASGRYRGVVGDRDSARADLVLEGRVLDFEEYVDGTSRSAWVALALSLRDEARDELLLQERVESKVPLHGREGGTLVHALHEALGVAFRSFLVSAEESAGAWTAPNRE